MPPRSNPIPSRQRNGKLRRWQQLPVRRIDLAGKPEEQFIMQWAGSLESLQKVLESRNWVFSPKWTWRDSIPYLDPNAVLGGVAPRPALHEGLKAKLTMIACPEWRIQPASCRAGLQDQCHS